jgi:hypothetical protein
MPYTLETAPKAVKDALPKDALSRASVVANHMARSRRTFGRNDLGDGIEGAFRRGADRQNPQVDHYPSGGDQFRVPSSQPRHLPWTRAIPVDLDRDRARREIEVVATERDLRCEEDAAGRKRGSRLLLEHAGFRPRSFLRPCPADISCGVAGAALQGGALLASNLNPVFRAFVRQPELCRLTDGTKRDSSLLQGPPNCHLADATLASDLPRRFSFGIARDYRLPKKAALLGGFHRSPAMTFFDNAQPSSVVVNCGRAAAISCAYLSVGVSPAKKPIEFFRCEYQTSQLIKLPVAGCRRGWSNTTLYGIQQSMPEKSWC